MAPRISGHSVGILAIKNGPGVFLNILSFPYTIEAPGKKPWTSIRVPVETGEHGETITKTASRAFEEEIIQKDSSFSFEFVSKDGIVSPVFFVLGKDEKSDDPNDLHLKAFFLVEFEGELRTEFYREPGPRGLEVHGLPAYNELGYLIKLMRDIGRVHAHEKAVLAAIAPLCADRETAMHYARLMSQYEEAEVTPEEAEMVMAYITEHLN